MQFDAIFFFFLQLGFCQFSLRHIRYIVAHNTLVSVLSSDPVLGTAFLPVSLSRVPDVSSAPARDPDVALAPPAPAPSFPTAGPFTVRLPDDPYAAGAASGRHLQFDLRDAAVLSGLLVSTDRDRWARSLRVRYAPWTVLHPERMEALPRGDPDGGYQFALFERPADQQPGQQIDRRIVFPQPVKTNRSDSMFFLQRRDTIWEKKGVG